MPPFMPSTLNPPQFYYPRTMTALAAVVFMLSRGLALALPAAQLFISADDRNRLWRDFRVRL